MTECNYCKDKVKDSKLKKMGQASLDESDEKPLQWLHCFTCHRNYNLIGREDLQ